jgi:uncharacterized protein (DUF488 family)
VDRSGRRRRRLNAVVNIYSIGFTQTTAEHFFGRLTAAGVRRVLDIRLNTSSQLAGFAKGRDLPFFLERIAGITYEHEPLLCPTPEILADFKQRKVMPWLAYEEAFTALMEQRRIAEVLSPASFDVPTALLCSEATPEQCHRRLVLEHLADRWDDVVIVHL